jgi:hypothetical protein
MGATTYQFQGLYEPDVVEVFAVVTFGAAGDPTLTRAKGVKSITRNDTGNYTFVFGKAASLFGDGIQPFSALLGFQASFEEATAADAPDAPLVFVTDRSLSDGAITVQCATDASVAADPGSGEIGYFRFTLSGQ